MPAASRISGIGHRVEYTLMEQHLGTGRYMLSISSAVRNQSGQNDPFYLLTLYIHIHIHTRVLIYAYSYYTCVHIYITSVSMYINIYAYVCFSCMFTVK